MINYLDGTSETLLAGDVIEMELKIEKEIEAMIVVWRDEEGLTTQFDGQLGIILQVGIVIIIVVVVVAVVLLLLLSLLLLLLLLLLSLLSLYRYYHYCHVFQSTKFIALFIITIIIEFLY